MRPLPFALVLALGLLGCPRRPAAPSPETPPGPTPPTPDDAGAPETDAGPAEEVPVALCTDVATCLPQHREALVAALREAENFPPEAHVSLAAIPLPAAFAWRAFLHHVGGRPDEATRLLRLLRHNDPDPDPPETPASALPPGSDPALARTLLALREHTEALLDRGGGDDEALLPCWLFARHTPEALYAFGPVHGSTLDNVVAAHHTRCLTAVARTRLGDAAEPALAAAGALSVAVRAVLPAPTDGTMFHAFAIDNDQQVFRPLLLGPTAPATPPDPPLQRLVTAAARRDRGVTRRMADYTRARATHAPAYGRAICAARPAPAPLSPAACTALGAAEADRALGSWLRALAAATAGP